MFIPRAENKALGPFITAEGEVECVACVRVCNKQERFTKFFPKDGMYDNRWQLLYKCPGCQRDYIIIAHEAEHAQE